MPGFAETPDKLGNAERANAPLRPKRGRLRPGLAWLSIVGIFSLSLEIELLQQIDSLRLYLTGYEIALEGSVALLLALVIASSWWLLVLVLGGLLRRFSRVERFHVFGSWILWIVIPLGYLVLDLFRDFRLELFPRWISGIDIQLLVALTLLTVCTVVMFRLGCDAIQNFCRSRLAPIAWLHIVVAVLGGVILVMNGVHLFHDYEHPANTQMRSGAPDIYLITIDALRADDMSLYGYNRATTPNLDAFSKRSFVFDYCFSNSNFTTPSTSSIETGKLPWSHRVFQFGGFLRGRDQQENIAAEVKQKGYYTAMATANFLAAPFRHRTLNSYDAVEFAAPIGLTGLRLRISNLVGVNTQASLELSLLRSVKGLLTHLDHMRWGDRYPYPADDVLSRSTQLLAKSRGAQSIFLWVHLLPPHDPYWVPLAFRHHFVSQHLVDYGRFAIPPDGKLRPDVPLSELRASYDEMILYADHSVGDFLNWLEETGRLDRSIVIISSDHGELFEHGGLTHGGPDLYNGLIHIPLLIHLPGQKNEVRVEQLAQQSDLLPTVLDLIGAPIPSWTDGASLKPLLNAGSVPDRYIFSMNLQPNRVFDPITKGTVAVMDSNFKFVRYLESGKELLYRYKSDVAEEHNILDSEPEVANRMRHVLLQKISDVNRRFDGKK